MTHLTDTSVSNLTLICLIFKSVFASCLLHQQASQLFVFLLKYLLKNIIKYLCYQNSLSELVNKDLHL